MTPVRVLLADDHMMVREGIRQLLELENCINVVGEAGDGSQCIKMIQELKPDVVLLDVNMPHLSGLEVLKKLQGSKINTKIIMLSFYNQVDIIERALNYGACGYVLKESESAILKKAICTVYNGETFIQPSIATVLRKHKLLNANNADSLTRREMEVLKLVVAGMYNKEIADKLNISEKTVKNHISSIFRKINVADRTQAAVYAIKNNLVEI